MMEKERQWKELDNFSRYKFSSCGEVYDREMDLIRPKTICGPEGGKYFYVHLVPDDTKVRSLFRLHRLTAKAWVEGGDIVDYEMVDHIDQDKFNNDFSNLRWVTRSENLKNSHSSLWVRYYGFTVYLKDLLSNIYPNDTCAYSWFTQRPEIRDVDVSTLLERYNERNNPIDEDVEYNNETRSLRELCELYDVDYFNTRKLLREGCTIYYALNNQFRVLHSMEVKSKTGVTLYFNNRQSLIKDVGQSYRMVNTMLNDGWLYEDMRDWKYEVEKEVLYIDGVGKTRDEWVKHYETTRSRVSTNMSKYNVSFEDAVVMPVLRVKFLIVNGVRMKVREFWESLGLNAKVTNDTKSKLKLSFTQTLRHFGIDDSKYNLEVV